MASKLGQWLSICFHVSVAASAYIAATPKQQKIQAWLFQTPTKAWIPLAPQLGAGAPTLPSFLLFSSSGDGEQLGLVFPCKRAHSRTALTGVLWASVVFPLRLRWEYPQHQVYCIFFLASQFTENFRWNSLHEEMQWNYSPQGNSFSLKNKLNGRSCMKWSSGNYSYRWASHGYSCPRAGMLKISLSNMTGKSN